MAPCSPSHPCDLRCGVSLSQLVINSLSSILSSDMSHFLLVCPATTSIKFLMNSFYELVFLTPVSSHFPMLSCLASSLGWFFQRNGIIVSLLSSKIFYCVLTAKLMFLVFSQLFQHVTMFFKPVDFEIDPNNTWHSLLCLLSMLLQLLKMLSLHISVLVMSPGPVLLPPSPQSLPLLVMLKIRIGSFPFLYLGLVNTLQIQRLQGVLYSNMWLTNHCRKWLLRAEVCLWKGPALRAECRRAFLARTGWW